MTGILLSFYTLSDYFDNITLRSLSHLYLAVLFLSKQITKLLSSQKPYRNRKIVFFFISWERINLFLIFKQKKMWLIQYSNLLFSTKKTWASLLVPVMNPRGNHICSEQLKNVRMMLMLSPLSRGKLELLGRWWVNIKIQHMFLLSYFITKAKTLQKVYDKTVCYSWPNSGGFK